jgi:hypothetical protein
MNDLDLRRRGQFEPFAESSADKMAAAVGTPEDWTERLPDQILDDTSFQAPSN